MCEQLNTVLGPFAQQQPKSLPQNLCDIIKNQINTWSGGPVHVHSVLLVEMFTC